MLEEVCFFTTTCPQIFEVKFLVFYIHSTHITLLVPSLEVSQCHETPKSFDHRYQPINCVSFFFPFIATWNKKEYLQWSFFIRHFMTKPFRREVLAYKTSWQLSLFG